MLNLRPYQKEAIKSIKESFASGVTKQMVVMSTGSGKTIVISQVPQEFPGKMLVLAHREELLSQAREKILWANPELDVSTEQAQQYANLDSDVVVASVPTLGRSNSDRINRFKKNHFRTIIVDEAHRSAAQTYKNIINYFDQELLIGFTATPQRSDKTRLNDIYDKIVFYKPMNELIKEGYLADFIGYKIKTETDISHVASNDGDYVESQLAKAIDTPQRNKLIINSIKELVPGKQTIIFCAGVTHAQNVTDLANKLNLRTEIITGETNSEERKNILKRFRNKTTQVLTNVSVFVEGFDEPSIECVALARPTKSSLLYSQALGRGSRLWEDKKFCTILDFTDASKGKNPTSLPTLMGLPEDFDLTGTSVTEAAETFKELEDTAPEEAARVKNISDIKDAWERIDLFRPAPTDPEILEFSNFVWMNMGNDRYVLNVGNSRRMEIALNPLGTYTVRIKKPGKKRDLGNFDTLQEAFHQTDSWVKEHFASQTPLIDAKAQWRNEPPTNKQLKWLRKYNIPITDDLTKGQCSLILDKIFQQNPKPDKPKWLERKIESQKYNF